MRRASALDLDEVLIEVLAGSPPSAESEETEGDGATVALLDATLALLSEQGIRHWTVDDVADRAGVGRATVYRRFKSRDELVRAAVTREARRFFGAVAESVRAVEPLEEKVVSGFMTGLHLARSSPLGALIGRDPAAAMSVLSSESLLRAATSALTERYEAWAGRPLSPVARARAEVTAEALVRLGISFVLLPGPTTDLSEGGQARERLAAIIRPLLSG